MPAPPEVLFDRFFRQNHAKPLRPEDPDPRLYRGKKDLSLLPPLTESLLKSIQESYNDALLNEKKDVPEHVAHPPFHFDYIDSTVPNAIAFCYESHSFIGVTMELVNLLWDICVRLSRSKAVTAILGIQASPEQQEPTHVVLFRIQLSFVISHEYTHHVHGHLSKYVFSDEILNRGNSGNLEQQAIEVDADGYAAYHVLAHLMESEGRLHALRPVETGYRSNRHPRPSTVFLFCHGHRSFLFALPPVTVSNPKVYRLSHPPQAARMNSLMQQAINWCKQNRSALAAWMTLSRFQKLLRIVEETTWGMNGGCDWAEQTAFLQSAEGIEYTKELDKSFKAHVLSL